MPVTNPETRGLLEISEPLVGHGPSGVAQVQLNSEVDNPVEVVYTLLQADARVRQM
jgi:hypothetical protein